MGPFYFVRFLLWSNRALIQMQAFDVRQVDNFVIMAGDDDAVVIADGMADEFDDAIARGVI